jgi:pimeloyl-ACP methyl ester carboxylesterase
MNAQRPLVILWLAVATLVGCREPVEPRRITAATLAHASGAEDDQSANVVMIDHAVPHVSTVAANMGERVGLFVRERVRGDMTERRRPAVLMIHGRSVPVLAASELRYADYDWALWLARSGGFDVFMLDFQGSGRSPRPRMDDPCNVPAADQERLLIPHTLPVKCPPSYPSTLNTSASDLDELDTVVDYIRDLRRVDKVHLVGWSAGAFGIGPYAVMNPDKVASLFFFAPIFNTGFRPPPPPATPMTLTSRADLFTGFGVARGWDAEVKCADQREPGIQDVVWAAIMENDELGRRWGPPPAGAPTGSAPEGVMRVRTVGRRGWDATVASQISVPTLIIRGEFDTGQGGLQHVAELYGFVKNDNKLRFTVKCAGHFMQWEKQRSILHQISKEWIKHGRVGGFTQGEFVVDTEGNLTPEPAP